MNHLFENTLVRAGVHYNINGSQSGSILAWF